MVGIPGAGKSTLAERVKAKGFACLNADSIRLELYGNEIEQGDKDEVFAIFFERLDKLLATGDSIVIDNTNINERQRKPIIDRARAAGYEDIQLWLVDTPLDVCQERNKSRARIVPQQVVAGLHGELTRNGRPKRHEGKIVVIRPDPQDPKGYLFFPQN